MSGYFAVGKYVLTLALYAGYLTFAFHINEQMKQCVGSIERAAILSLSIVGIYFLMRKVSEYFSSEVA